MVTLAILSGRNNMFREYRSHSFGLSLWVDHSAGWIASHALSKAATRVWTSSGSNAPECSARKLRISTSAVLPRLVCAHHRPVTRSQGYWRSREVAVAIAGRKSSSETHTLGSDCDWRLTKRYPVSDQIRMSSF